jgi:hypothetical protein
MMPSLIERFSRGFRERFVENLQAVVPPECAERWKASETISRLRAVEGFLKVTALLLKQSHRIAPIWLYENPGDRYCMDEAQSRVRHLHGPNRRKLPWEQDYHPDRLRRDQPLDLITPEREGHLFIPADDGIRRVAREVAYLVFRHLIPGKLKVSFCPWCNGAFELGKETKFAVMTAPEPPQARRQQRESAQERVRTGSRRPLASSKTGFHIQKLGNPQLGECIWK